MIIFWWYSITQTDKNLVETAAKIIGSLVSNEVENVKFVLIFVSVWVYAMIIKFDCINFVLLK